jgi:polar amino acid transport system substrate-binding protein
MTAYAGTLASPGVLTIGVDESPPPPLNFGLPGSPDFVGFEVDLTRAIAQRLGLGVTCVSELWSRILEDLRRDRLDLICTAATVTPDRSKVVDFGDPYLDTELVIVVKSDGRLPTSADLAGADVGARIATVAEECARARLGRARIRTFDFNTDAYAALETGEVDAGIDDRPIATHFARSRPGLEIARVIEGTGSHYALMFAKGNDGLREAMNRALAELRADGTYERIHGTWFGEEPAPMALHEKKEAAMIARIWHGRTRAEHADTYLDYMKQTGVHDIRNLPSNLAVQVWRRLRGGEANFLFVSWWPSLESIRGFAGDDLERAVYYPRDREYLLELDPRVEHYEVMVDER